MPTTPDSACQDRQRRYLQKALLPRIPQDWQLLLSPASARSPDAGRRSAEQAFQLPEPADPCPSRGCSQGTDPIASAHQSLAQNSRLFVVPDALTECKLQTRSIYNVPTVKEMLRNTQFLTMDNRFKIFKVEASDLDTTADSLSDLLDQGEFKSFHQHIVHGLNCFLVEYA